MNAFGLRHRCRRRRLVSVVGDELLVPDRLDQVGTVVDFFSSIHAVPSIHCFATLSMPASYFVKPVECLAVLHTVFVVLLEIEGVPREGGEREFRGAR